MQQQELFDFRRDILFERDNQIARFYDVLSETEDTISYAEHIDPKKKFSICGMDYEEYVDVQKKYLKSLTLSLIHISEPTRPRLISYAVFCLKKKKKKKKKKNTKKKKKKNFFIFFF